MLNGRKYLGFNDIPMMLIGIPLLGVVIPVLFFGLDHVDDPYVVGHILGSMIFSGSYWIGDRYIFILFHKLFPEQKENRKRIILQTIVIVVFTISFCEVLKIFTDPLMGKDQIPEIDQVPGWRYDLVSLFVTLTIGAIYETMYALGQLRNVLLESEKLKKENLRAQLESLKDQVNPHFLFNSLNTLASIIPEDPEMAVEFVQKLSKVYRYILEIRDRELISLKEELECINAYKFLCTIRFGKNLQVRVELGEDKMEQQIVPLSLQMLLENAIKHNVVSSKKPLTILIGEGRSGEIVVTNNLQIKNIDSRNSTKTGLENIKQRYRILSGKEVEVIQTADKFRVVLPTIETELYEGIDH